MSSTITPRRVSTSNSAAPKSSPTGPTGRTSVKKLVASEKWTAVPPSMRSRSPNGVLTESKAIEPTTVRDMGAGYRESGVPRLRKQRGGADEVHPTPFLRRRLWFSAVKAIQIDEFGGPEVLQYRDVDDPVAGEGEVLVEVARSGINFADTHATRNDYLAAQELPLIPGAEVSGRTAEGTRVAAILGSGGYAEKVAVPEGFLVPVPDGVDDDQAAALLLQGLTAMALVRRCARVEPGETLVVEAAAGGTGSLAVQLAKRAGAKVIGLASSEEKRALAERLGADATADSRADDLREAILEANGGERGDVVLHMSGTGLQGELQS